MALFELYLLTFNCARNLVKPQTLAPHFFDALPQNSPLPDVIAISLQEIAPIAYSFLGGSYLTPYFNHVAATVQLAAELHGDGSQVYEHISTRNLGMTAIMLFAKPAFSDRIRWLQSAGTGVGLWKMGNKGAVAVRIGISLDNGEDELSMTFTAAHLAPMEWALERRNKDWENIVRNLVFVNNKEPKGGSGDEQPLLSSSAGPPGDNEGLYSPGNHIFFAGDLNYRTSNDAPGPKSHLGYPQPVSSEASPHHFSHFLKNDQLNRELEASRTLHGFQELPITFPPTYKYSNKRFLPPNAAKRSDRESEENEDVSSWLWAKHRYPSWCDRLLWLPSPNIQPRSYTSLPLQPTSDHQPVALALGIKLEPLREEHLDGLRSNPPFPININWKQRNDAARRRELVVGVMSYLALTKKGNALLVVVAGIAFASWWMAHLLGSPR